MSAPSTTSFRRIAVPATRSSTAVLGVRRRVVVVLLALVIVSGVLSLVVSLTRDTGSVAAAPLPASALAVAEEAGRDFLASRDSQVPAAEGVRTTWSETAQGQPAADAYKTPAFTVSSFSYAGHTTYTLGDAADQLVHLTRFRVLLNGRPYNLDVPVTDTDSGAVLAGAPALLPARTGEQPVPAVDYGNYAEVADVTAAVKESVADWLTYYTRDGADSKDLKTLAADQSGRTYDGLGGWTGEVRGVTSALPVGGAETGKPAGVVVQVDVVLTPPAANGPSLSTTYDLYVVTEGDPARPPVVAWGTAGSVDELTPYMNAN